MDEKKYLVNFSFDLTKRDGVRSARVSVDENTDDLPEPYDSGVVHNNRRSYTILAIGEEGVIDTISEHLHGPLAIWRVWNEMRDCFTFSVLPADGTLPKRREDARPRPVLIFRRNANAEFHASSMPGPQNSNERTKPMSNTNILASRAMIVYLNISQWSGRRLDREVTSEVNSSHGAKQDASRVNKLLLPAEAFAPINRIVSAARAGFIEKTLPWINDGGRIMPAEKYLEHAQWMRDTTSKFKDAVDAFVLEYPNYLQAARYNLGTMFKAEDYPATNDVARRFAMEMKVLPVPTGNDFRVDLAGDQLAAIRADIERNVEEAARAGTADLVRRISEVTGAMVEKLSAYRPAKGKGQKSVGVFRDSLVTNIADLVGILPSLNITDDPLIAEITGRLEELTRTSPQELRDNKNARESVKAEAERIFSIVDSWA